MAKSGKFKLSLAHFNPFSMWRKVDYTKEKKISLYPLCPELYGNERIPGFYNLMDLETEDLYFEEDILYTRLKCVLLTISTPIFQTLIVILHTVINLLKLITLYDFTKEINNEDQFKTANDIFNERLYDTAFTLLHVLFAPICIVLMELSALYGIFSPHNGRKLYASFERLINDDNDEIESYLGISKYRAPCFQPYRGQ